MNYPGLLVFDFLHLAMLVSVIEPEVASFLKGFHFFLLFYEKLEKYLYIVPAILSLIKRYNTKNRELVIFRERT